MQMGSDGNKHGDTDHDLNSNIINKQINIIEQNCKNGNENGNLNLMLIILCMH